MKTGKTAVVGDVGELLVAAAMEPGHEDREDRDASVGVAVQQPAAMEPGHEDREDSGLSAARRSGK